jgi:hypothetical protein
MEGPLRSAEYYWNAAARLRREAVAITHAWIWQQVLSIAACYEELAETVAMPNRQRGAPFWGEDLRAEESSGSDRGTRIVTGISWSQAFRR